MTDMVKMASFGGADDRLKAVGLAQVGDFGVSLVGDSLPQSSSSWSPSEGRPEQT